ncbi:MAG: DNA polymerase III subunit alpha [Planctomycetaceae bacterium]|nr:DNA polymerase III subunit alpha [Planctomycetaceae bacterium]
MSVTRPFAHLHVHSYYSMLDGANRLDDLVGKVKDSGMNAVALTDHGNLCGAFEFYNTCKSAGVKPIVGYEAYIAPGSRTDRSASRMKEASFHLTLLAMNRTGYFNLIRLASRAYIEGFYYRPRIDKELLEEFNEGLICLSGCAAGELSQLLLQDKMSESRDLVGWYEKVFGDRYYLEIQNCGLDIQRICQDGTVDLSQRLGVPLVATNDAHYLHRSDAGAQDVLLCISTRAMRSDEKRMRMTGDEFYVRTPDEMYAAFPDHADAVARSQEIADRIDIDLDLNAKHYPVFSPPRGLTDTEYLRELCSECMLARYGNEATQAHWDRLDMELKVIEKMGYSSYFLIVHDFVVFAEENHIPCQARGSACGAIVAFLLGFGNVCPLKYDLLFERFLDESRTEPPDIDIDFCRDRRQMVIDYTKAKYGEDCVAQIGTFGTLKAKAAIRDVGRVLGVPLPRVDEICKSVPEQLGIKIKDAIKESPDLQGAYDSDSQIKEMLDIAQRLEGLARNVGTHAAGLVIADTPLEQLLPLQTIVGKTDVITQWDGPHVEMAGLLKMDFLGLRNLTILDKTVLNVKKIHGKEIDPVSLPLDDKQTFALLQRGETKGIFQLESGGMRDLLTKMRPDSFQDIIATSALYRPGPLEGGMVMDYVNVKNGHQEPAQVHPVVDEILEETYGVMVYQEQVMRILNRVGNIPLPAAYRCIKAISKKKLKIIAGFKKDYIEGAQSNGIGEDVAENLFTLIEKFAGYGFNKSHSTAYGAISYQTAYFKAHYPREFMAALLSCGMESSDRISEHVDDARRMGIEVQPPDVNRSEVEFGVDGEKLTFGLGAIKGVGEEAMGVIVAEREANGPFSDIFNLAERVDPKCLTKGAFEILIKAGALNSLGPNQAQHMLVMERAVQSAVAKQRDRARGQKSLFGDDSGAAESESGEEEVLLPEAPDWTHSQKLACEKDVFGFYLTSHPLTEFSGQLEAHATHSTLDLAEMDDGSEVMVGGMISSIKRAATKKPSRNGHTRYANFDFEDSKGVVRCIMWPEDFARLGEKVVPEAMCFIRGKVDRRSREPNLIVNQLLTLEQADKEFTKQLAIKFQRGMHSETDMLRAREILQQFPGKTEVVVVVDTVDEQVEEDRVRFVLTTPNSMRVSCSHELRSQLNQALGSENFEFIAPKSTAQRRPAGVSIGR